MANAPRRPSPSLPCPLPSPGFGLRPPPPPAVAMITGGPPRTGFRLTLEREPGSPLVYRGTVALPSAELGVVAEVADDLSVAVTLDPAPPDSPLATSALAEKVRLLVRQAVRQGEGDPARKIVRWRGEK